MRTQNEISREFFKFPSQIIHFLGLPIFFFVFVLIYRPKTTIEFLDIRGFMEFNLIILSCIQLLVMVGTSLAFFLFPCGVMCLTLIDQIMIQALLFVLLLGVLFPFYVVGWCLYCFYLFDEFTNKETYPALYKKGLKAEFIQKEKE